MYGKLLGNSVACGKRSLCPPCQTNRTFVPSFLHIFFLFSVFSTCHPPHLRVLYFFLTSRPISGKSSSSLPSSPGFTFFGLHISWPQNLGQLAYERSPLKQKQKHLDCQNIAYISCAYWHQASCISGSPKIVWHVSGRHHVMPTWALVVLTKKKNSSGA